jgi:hypothetical protein
MNKLHEKLKKLLALTEQGLGGEKINAQEKLEKLMKKHGIQLSDFIGEAITLEWFKSKPGKIQKQLLYQIIVNVCGNKTDTYASPLNKGKIGVKVTKSQQVEIELKYISYMRSLEKELNLTYEAFVQTNHIFPTDAEDEIIDPSKIEIEELERLAYAMQGMKPVMIQKTLAKA